jgi:DegV family protein with EDD domain
MSIAIVTDSTSDLSPETIAHYPIHVVPNILVIDGQSFEDGKGISRQEYYERLPLMKTVPTTASASAGTFQTLYANILQQGVKHIVSLHPPMQLSGIFNAAYLAAQSFGDQVKVLDSGQITLGMGYQALAAAEAAVKNLPFEAILHEIDRIRQRVHVYAMLDTLEYVRRSGRVSWARARLGSLLDIKPIVEFREGNVFNLGEARSRHKGVDRLIRLLQKLGPLDRLAILHTNSEKDAYQIMQDLKVELTGSPILVNVTTIIGTHTGPNALGIAAVTR